MNEQSVIKKPENPEHVRLLEQKREDYRARQTRMIDENRWDTWPEKDRVFNDAFYAYLFYAMTFIDLLLRDGQIELNAVMNQELREYTDTTNRPFQRRQFHDAWKNFVLYTHENVGMDHLLQRLDI